MQNRYAEKKPTLPTTYVEFIEANNGWEGELGQKIGYVVIWDKDTIQERWDAYEMRLYLDDRWFPFGSDGGGEMLCFDLQSKGDTVYTIPYVGMSGDEAMLRCKSFREIARIVNEKH
jgi:hypothetical protein